MRNVQAGVARWRLTFSVFCACLRGPLTPPPSSDARPPPLAPARPRPRPRAAAGSSTSWFYHIACARLPGDVTRASSGVDALPPALRDAVLARLGWRS